MNRNEKNSFYQMYIDGNCVGSEKQETIAVINPATKKSVGRVPNGGRKVAKLAVRAAEKAFQTWSKKTAEERGIFL